MEIISLFHGLVVTLLVLILFVLFSIVHLILIIQRNDRLKKKIRHRELKPTNNT